MAKKIKNKVDDPLIRLVSAAERDVLAGLTLELAAEGMGIRRKCLDYLKKHIIMSTDRQEEAEGEVLMALWMELEPDLSELDEYGGGDRRTEDHVDTLLYDLAQKLEKGKVPRDYRRQLLDEVIRLKAISGSGGYSCDHAGDFPKKKA